MVDSTETADLLNPKVTEPKKLTRQDVIGRLEQGEDLNDLDLKDLNLAGLALAGKSFKRSDIRGMSLYEERDGANGTIIEITTNIQGADFTDAIIADTAQGTDFYSVDAEGATFGYTESIVSRRISHPKDGGGLFRFDGRGGNFKRTRWTNTDFGGGTGFEAMLEGADLSGAVMEGCLLAEIDLSKTNIEDISIIGTPPLFLNAIKINAQQVKSLAQAIKLTDEKEQSRFEEEIRDNGQRKALEDHFGTIIVKTED
jgi:uncharacterized protein YjbI with pentapeptide repeats